MLRIQPKGDTKMPNNYIIPTVGQIYRNRNGSEYRCTGNAAYPDDIQKERSLALGEHRASMLRLTDGWAIEVYGIHQYEDGTVEWNYSSGGSFQSESLALCCQKCRENGKDMGRYFRYLDFLRDAGAVNMFGAIPYLQETFPELHADDTWAKAVLTAWMDSFRSSTP